MTKTKINTKHRKRPAKQAKRPQLKRRHLLGGFIVLAIVVVFAFIYSVTHTTAGRLVTIHDRGENHVILTRATTVQAALHDANVTVTAQDVVEPSITSELASTDSAVIIYRSRPVLVIDGSYKQKVVTAAAAPNEIALAAGAQGLQLEDKASISEGSLVTDGASQVLTIDRHTPVVVIPEKKPTPNSLTPSKGAQLFVDSNGVAHRETYYDLPMNIVINACGAGDYTIRYDGAKIDKDGYVLVAANYGAYPRCSVVETSMGPGKVYDTGGFALRYPHGFDLATDWTNYNGR